MGRIEELKEKINQWNSEYWEGHPSVTDQEYDKALRELNKLDPNNQQKDYLGSIHVEEGQKAHHSVPMLSLDKAYTLEELQEWLNRTTRTPDEVLLVQPKYDGISADWSNGVLSTRGDGHDGENITDKLPLIRYIEYADDGYWNGIPVTEHPDPIRGEIVMMDQDFQDAQEHGSTYKNQRNSVAGILGAKYSTAWARQMREQHICLTLISHSEISIETTPTDLIKNFDDICSTVLSQLAVPCDGIVIRLADEEYGESLGYTSHHPKCAIAYKFVNEKANTVLKDVEWSVGLNKVTPVAILEPVDMDGVTVSRASLHNMKNIIDRDLHIGDTVTVERAGEVIPYISSSTPGTDRKEIKCERCPSCNQPLSYVEPELICTNEHCMARLIRNISMSSAALGIDGLADKTVEKILYTFPCQDIFDILELREDQYLSLPGFQARLAHKIYTEVQKARTTKDYKILAAMNIPGVGEETAKAILSFIKLEHLPSAALSDLSEIPGVGIVRAAAISTYMNNHDVPRYISLFTYEDSQNSDSDLMETLPKVVFTGAMPEPRNYYRQLALANGYQPEDSVTKDTKLLVVPEEGHISTKVTKAEKYEVEIITLKQFLERIGK